MTDWSILNPCEVFGCTTFRSCICTDTLYRELFCSCRSFAYTHTHTCTHTHAHTRTLSLYTVHLHKQRSYIHHTYTHYIYTPHTQAHVLTYTHTLHLHSVHKFVCVCLYMPGIFVAIALVVSSVFENVAFFGDLLIRMHDIVRQVSRVAVHPQSVSSIKYRFTTRTWNGILFWNGVWNSVTPPISIGRLHTKSTSTLWVLQAWYHEIVILYFYESPSQTKFLWHTVWQEFSKEFINF